MAAQTCTWLHLSDLHFRESTSWDADIVLRELLKDIKARVTVDDLRPNLIFVTGDIAYSGKKSEYRLAATFFDQLLGVTGLDKKHLFVVPGNHDVDREAITPGTQSITRGLDSRDKLNQHFQTPSDRQAVFQKFRQFAGFVNKYFEDHVPFDDEHYYYVRLLTIAKRRVAILGLNSAWLSLSDEDRNHLALGERQVRNALDRASGADLKIALLHHPFDWLYDFDREDIETLLQSECDFILRGHLHRTGAQYLTTPDSAAMILTGGACYKTRAYPNTYHFVRLDFSAGRGTVVLRRYSPSNFWAKDTLTYKNASNGEYSFHLDSKPSLKSEHVPAEEDAISLYPSPTPTPTYLELRIYLYERDYVLEFESQDLLVRPLRPIPTAELPRDLPIDEVADRIVRRALQEHGLEKWQRIGAQGGRLRLSIENQLWFQAQAAELQTAIENKLFHCVSAPSQPGEKTKMDTRSDSTPPSAKPFNEYAIATTRQLLTDAFTAADLRRFCQDRPLFRPIIALFPSQSLADMIDAVIDYCRTRALFPELLVSVEQARPRHFQRYHASLGMPGETPPAAEPPPVTEKPRPTHPLTEVAASLAFEQGQRFFDAKDWESAILSLEKTVRLDPQHQEAQDLLRVAREEWQKEQQRKREEARLTALYERAKEHIQEEGWQEAGLLLEEVVRSNPAFRDAQMLLESARTEIEQEAQERQQQQTLAFYYERADQHFQAREWTEAIRFFEMVQELEKDYRKVKDKLSAAYRNQQLDQWDREARQSADRGDWSKTIRHLRRIESTTPQYPGLQERLDSAQRQEKLASLYTTAQEDLKAGRWKAARDRLREIVGLDEHYRDAPAALHYALAQVAVGEEKWDEALEHFSWVVQTARGYRDAALRLEEAQKQAQLSQLYAIGQRHLKAHAWEQAQSALTQVLTLDPHYLDAAALREQAEQEGRWVNLYHRAERYLALQRWDEALKVLRQIEVENPRYQDIKAKLKQADWEKQLADLYREGLEQIGEGDWRDAVLAFEQIVGLAPDYRDAREQLEAASRKQQVVEHYDRGNRAYQARDWATAIAALEQVVDLEPGYLDAEVKLAEARKQQRLARFYEEGREHFDREEWKRAVCCFQEVVNLEPAYIDATNLLTESQLQAELARIYQEAQEAFEKGAWTQTSELLTRLPKSYHQDLVLEMGRQAEKQQQLETLYKQAKQLYDAQRWAEAVPVLEKIRELEEDYHDAGQMLDDVRYQIEVSEHYRAGIQAFDSRNWDRAIEQLTWVVDKDSYYQDALTRLSEARRAKRLAELYDSAQVHKTQQAWPEAMAAFEEIVRIDPDHLDSQQQLLFCEAQARLQMWYEEGKAFLEQEQWKKAADIFRRIAAESPDYADAADRLARAETELHLTGWYENGCRYLGLGRWEDAIEQFARVLEERSNYRDAAPKLEEAKQEKHLADGWTRVHDLLNPEQAREVTPTDLEQAVDSLAEIVSRDEGYRGGKAQALLEQTQNQLAALRERIEQERAEEERRRQEKLTSVYAQASELLDEKQHRQAIPLLEEILRIQPGYRDAEEKLKQAKRLKPFQPVAQFVERIKRSNWARSLESRSGNRRVPVLIGVSILLVIVLCAGTVIILLGGNGTPTPTSIAVVTTPAPTTPTSIAVVTTPAPTTPMPTATSLSPTSQATITATAIEPTTPGTPTEMPVIAPTSTSTPSPTPTATATAVPSPTPVLPTKTLTPALPPPLSPAPTSRLSGKIAFPLYDPERRTYDVYVCNADGSNRRRIATEASQPEMPPSGNMIAFRSWNDSSRGITVMDLDGSNRFNATNSLEDARPSWATNKSLLLFSRKEADRNGRLYVDGAWQGEETQLIQHGTSPAYGETPSWLNMDRQTVVYSLCNPGCGIFVCNRNGQGPTRLLDDPGKTTPEGSPDGTHIAFMSNRDGNWEIYVMNADASKLKRLTNDSAIDGLPTWSPDGSYIAFVSNRTGNQNWSIWAIRPDGTGLQKLFDLDGTMDGVVDEEPTYSSAGWKEEQISWTR